MMSWIKIRAALAILGVLLTISGADDTCLNQDVAKSAEYRLINDLMCNYDKMTRPVKNHTKTLEVSMTLRVLTVIPGDENNGDDSITVTGLMVLLWLDQYLMWTPGDYEGINEVIIAASKIWVPQLIMLNSGMEPPSMPYESSAECRVTNDGYVTCFPKVSYTASCQADHLRWPFDSQVCKLSYRVLSYRGDAIDLKKLSMSTKSDVKNVMNDWDVVSFNCTPEVQDSKISNYTFPMLHYIMELKRNSATYAAIVIAPAFGMMLLTLMSLSMNVASQERMLLITVNMFCHFLYLQQLFWYVPPNGETCPLVVLFYRDSLMVTVFLLLSTLLLKSMLSSTSGRFETWVATINKPPVNLLMFRLVEMEVVKDVRKDDTPKDEVTATDDKTKTEVEDKWKLIVLFLDRIQLITIVLTYTGLIVALFI